MTTEQKQETPQDELLRLRAENRDLGNALAARAELEAARTQNAALKQEVFRLADYPDPGATIRGLLGNPTAHAKFLKAYGAQAFWELSKAAHDLRQADAAALSGNDPVALLAALDRDPSKKADWIEANGARAYLGVVQAAGGRR